MNKSNIFYTFLFSSLLSLPAIENIDPANVIGSAASDQRIELVQSRSFTSLINDKLIKVSSDIKSIKKSTITSIKPKIIVLKKQSNNIVTINKTIKKRFEASKKKYISQKINLKSSAVLKKINNKKLSNNASLSKYELNSNELTTHYGFNIKHSLKLIDFSKIKIHLPVKIEVQDVLAKQENMKDEISLLSSATVKKKLSIKISDEERIITEFKKSKKGNANRSPSINSLVDLENDQLVSFDYSKSGKEIDLTIKKPLISKSVLDSVNRIMASQGKSKNTTRAKFISPSKIKTDQVKLLLASHKRSNSKRSPSPVNSQKTNLINEKMHGLLYDQKESEYSKDDKVASVLIKAIDIHIDSIGSDILTNFEFIPTYDENIRLYDDASGELEIEQKLSGDLSLLNGRIVSRDGVTTYVTIPMEQGKVDFNIPILNKENFSNFLNKEKMNLPGGFLLIKLDSNTDSVDISSHYAGRIFLDDNFKVASIQSDYTYILYAGVKPGNTLLRLLSFNNEIAEKIIHITENEIFYEKVQYISSSFEKFEVKESRLLGKTGYELNIDGDKINYFNTKSKSKNISINTYKIKHPLLIQGMRKYYEFNHLDHSIFVGKWNKKFVEIPGSDYIDYIFDAFTLESLEGRCMVQVNLASSAVDFAISGISDLGAMNLEVKFLDEDGLFNDEITPLAKKVFIIGQREGVINYKLSYNDSSSDIVQSTCSSSSYLVEQL